MSNANGNGLTRKKSPKPTTKDKKGNVVLDLLRYYSFAVLKTQ